MVPAVDHWVSSLLLPPPLLLVNFHCPQKLEQAMLMPMR